MIQRSLRQAERAGGEEQPRSLIALVQHPAALVSAADDMAGVDMAIVDMERTGVGRAPAERPVLLAAGVARCFVRNEKQRELLLLGFGGTADGQQQREQGNVWFRTGDEGPLAAYHPGVVGG